MTFKLMNKAIYEVIGHLFMNVQLINIRGINVPFIEWYVKVNDYSIKCLIRTSLYDIRIIFKRTM